MPSPRTKPRPAPTEDFEAAENDDQVAESVDDAGRPSTVTGRFDAVRRIQRSREVIAAGSFPRRDTRFRHFAEQVRAPSRNSFMPHPQPSHTRDSMPQFYRRRTPMSHLNPGNTGMHASSENAEALCRRLRKQGQRGSRSRRKRGRQAPAAAQAEISADLGGIFRYTCGGDPAAGWGGVSPLPVLRWFWNKNFLIRGCPAGHHCRLVRSGLAAMMVWDLGAGRSPLLWLHRRQITMRLSMWSCPPFACA